MSLLEPAPSASLGKLHSGCAEMLHLYLYLYGLMKVIPLCAEHHEVTGGTTSRQQREDRICQERK